MKLLLLLLLFLPQETVILDDAVQTDLGAVEFKVAVFLIERYPSTQLVIGLQEHSNGFVEGGKHINITLSNTEALVLIRQLNVMDFTSTSLEKRIIIWAQANGRLGPGAISGVPEVP